MTDAATNDGEKIRLVLGPRATEKLRDIPIKDRVTKLDDLLDEADGKHSVMPAVGAGMGPEIYKVLRKLAEGVEAVLMSQTTTLSVMTERFEHFDSEQGVTRGLIGTVLTEGDERLAVNARMEEVLEEQRGILKVLAKRVGKDHQNRRQEFGETINDQLAPLLHGKDADQEEVQIKPRSIGERTR